ncbi:MAG: hypothetical protein AAGC77_04730 [Pseudomonadota bacterium]
MSIDGTYTLNIKTPMGDQAGELTLKQEGDAVTGDMKAATGAATVENGALNGDTITWSANVTSPMPMTLEFEGKVDGDNIAGNVKLGAFGNSTFSAVKN